MQIPLRWGKNAKKVIGLRHPTPTPHSLEARVRLLPHDRWWGGGRPMKRSQRQRRRDKRRGY